MILFWTEIQGDFFLWIGQTLYHIVFSGSPYLYFLYAIIKHKHLIYHILHIKYISLLAGKSKRIQKWCFWNLYTWLSLLNALFLKGKAVADTDLKVIIYFINPLGSK